MADNIKKLAKLYALYARMDLRWFTQDLYICLMVIIGDWISIISSISGLFLLAARFGGIGGMSTDEILWMLGYFALSNGVLFMFFGNFNVHQISRRVGRGQVDHMLIQPVPLWMQVLTEGFMPVSGNSSFLSGVILLVIASARLHLSVTPLWFLCLLIMIATRVAIEMGLSFFAASWAFYKPVACEEISSVVHDTLTTLGRYPLFGLPGILTEILITVIPAGLMAWWPSMILLSKESSVWAMMIPVTVGAVSLSLANHFFRKGLRYYAKVGSSRYRDMGHRG